MAEEAAEEGGVESAAEEGQAAEEATATEEPAEEGEPPATPSAESGSSVAPEGRAPTLPWPVFFRRPRTWQEWVNFKYEEGELWHA